MISFGILLMSCAILKLSMLRCVCAPKYACAGTFTSPIVSFSILYSIKQFFINDQGIGGFTDLKELDEQKKLDTLLQEKLNG